MACLLTPIRIGPVEARNRIVMPPMVRLAPHVPAELLENAGEVTPPLVDHYRRRAASGVGLIIVEATCVDPSGRVWKHGLNAYDDAHIAGLRDLASAIADGGAVPGIQLVHGGPQADPALSGGSTWGPSAVAPSVGEPEPRELDLRSLLEVQQRFIQAAERAAQAGFRLIEAHAAHGYLLDSFLSPMRNHRTDAFGGTIENRLRMTMDIVLRMKAAIGSRAAVGCRISVFNHIADGFGLHELLAMVSAIDQAHADFVDLSSDRVLRSAFGTDKTMGQIASETTPKPVIVTGGLSSPTECERVIAEGHGDLAGVGRAMLANPDWAAQAIEQLRE